MARHKSEHRCVTVLSKKEGVGGGEEEGAPLSHFGSRERAVLGSDAPPQPKLKPHHGAQRRTSASRLMSGWGNTWQLSVRWSPRSRFHDVHLQHRVCGVFLLHLIVRETCQGSFERCTVCPHTHWITAPLHSGPGAPRTRQRSEPHPWLSLLSSFFPHPPSLYFKLLILSGSAQTSLSCTVTPRREWARVKLCQARLGLVPVLWCEPAPGLLPLGWANISPEESLLTPQPLLPELWANKWGSFPSHVCHLNLNTPG